MRTKTLRAVAALSTLAAGILGVASSASARPGPDVTYQDVTDITNHGLVGVTRAYSLGTATCNIGNQNLLWTNNGTPAVGFNMYRLFNGRLEQIGLSFCKTACCAGAGTGCNLPCNGQGGPVLGAGCRDVYGSGWNAIQSRLAPRSAINAYTGAIATFAGTSGDNIFRRLQVRQSDLQQVGFPGAQYFVEGQYVGTDDAQNGNALNNATYRRVTINQSTFDLTMQGTTQAMVPAIRAWRDHGLGANTPDPSVNLISVDVPNEGRFWVASKVTPLAGGRFRYDYAVFNLNSDRSGGSFAVTLAAGVTPTNIGFHDVSYHSGEVYDGTDWPSTINSNGLQWATTQTFFQNPNANALRWGTMYNFWFEANTPPTTGQATLGLFKPHTPNSVSFTVSVPSAACQADWNDDGAVTSADFFDFISDFFNNNADFDADGSTTSQDFFDFLAIFFTPC